MYTFNDEKERQRNRGAKRLVLTDAVDEVYITWWESKHKEKAMKEGMDIFLQRIYVDDINVIARMSKDFENENYETEKKQRNKSSTMETKINHVLKC